MQGGDPPALRVTMDAHRSVSAAGDRLSSVPQGDLVAVAQNRAVIAQARRLDVVELHEQVHFLAEVLFDVAADCVPAMRAFTVGPADAQIVVLPEERETSAESRASYGGEA